MGPVPAESRDAFGEDGVGDGATVAAPRTDFVVLVTVTVINFNGIVNDTDFFGATNNQFITGINLDRDAVAASRRSGSVHPSQGLPPPVVLICRPASRYSPPQCQFSIDEHYARIG